MDKLAGKTALVTGSSRGIGRGIALALARAGADIAVNYRRDRDAALGTVAEIEKLGRRALAVPADVADWQQVVELFAHVLADFGHLDIASSDQPTRLAFRRNRRIVRRRNETTRFPTYQNYLHPRAGQFFLTGD